MIDMIVCTYYLEQHALIAVNGNFTTDSLANILFATAMKQIVQQHLFHNQSNRLPSTPKLVRSHDQRSICNNSR